MSYDQFISSGPMLKDLVFAYDFMIYKHKTWTSPPLSLMFASLCCCIAGIAYHPSRRPSKKEKIKLHFHKNKINQEYYYGKNACH